VNKDCQQYLSKINDNTISKFNLSNIFEWMPLEEFENILKEIIRAGTDQAILTYRNLLVPRCRPQSLSKWILPETELSQKLHAKDFSFIYKRYVVERLVK
jgi:S-adenosylmethionine-diacylglycerol 3-amino-3-carboxypropyl transferase